MLVLSAYSKQKLIGSAKQVFFYLSIIFYYYYPVILLFTNLDKMDISRTQMFLELFTE